MSSSGQYICAVINAGNIYTSNNYGQSWIITSAPAYEWTSVAMSSSGQYLCAVSNNGGIYTSNNYGQTWVATSALTLYAWRSVSMSSSGQYLYATDTSNVVYISNNYGVSCLLTTHPGININLNTVSCSSSGQHIYTGGGGNYISNNYGKTWSIISGAPSNIFASAMSSSGQYICGVRNGGGIYISSIASQFNTNVEITGNLGVTGTATFSNDILVNSLTVGKGGGNISSNIAFGSNALTANTTGTYNIAFGSGALAENTDGSFNTAIGNSVLINNTTGVYNVGIGNNTTLYNNTTGSENTAIGTNALINNTTGSQNNAIGRGALKYNTTASNNVAIGNYVLYSNTTGQNNTAIGDYAGEYYTLATGITGAQLNNNCIFIGYSSGTNIYGATGYTNSTAIGYNSMITASNQIVLGTATETYQFPGLTGYFGGYVQATTFNSTSDYRIKQNVEEIEAVVDNLRPVKYTNTITGNQDMGFIAHEVQELFPFLVSGEKDGPQNQAINYTGLIPLLVKEIQDLKKQVQQLLPPLEKVVPN